MLTYCRKVVCPQSRKSCTGGTASAAGWSSSGLQLCTGVQSINKTPVWAINTTQAIEDPSTQNAAGVLCSIANTSSLLPCFSRFCVGICYWF